MRIFAISDLHLSFGVADKPMDIFGDGWKDHPQRIEANWHETVRDGDWVLMSGDLSWAMNLDEVGPDLAFVDGLPGEKLMIKGNHGHWWASRTKVERVLPPSIRILQNDSFLLPDGTCIVGTRGWNPPGRSDRADGSYSEKDRRVYDREIGRLALSIEHSKRFARDRLWAMIHYPPVYSSGLVTDFHGLLARAGVERCIYGHLHGADLASGFVGARDGVTYHLVSCDHTDMKPVLLREAGADGG